MIQIDFSAEDIKKIKKLRYDDPDPKVRRRMEALWLKSQGLRHEEICRLTGISGNTLRQYLRLFQSGGVEKLMEINYYTPISELDQHRQQIAAYFRKHPPASINEAMASIEALTGIKRSPSAVGRFLNSLGMRLRKVGATPSRGDPDEQESFRINKLEPRLAEAKQGKRAIFLSTPPTSYLVLFSDFCGHLRASFYRHRPVDNVLTFSAH